MNEKQKKFADYYIETGNASESARKAGYSDTYATTHVYKLLENARVKKYIEEETEKLKSERVADQQEVMEYYTRVMRGEELEEHAFTVTDKEFDGEGNMTMSERIETVKLEPKIRDRNKAAEQLGKRYAMWTDNKNVEVAGMVQFVDDIGEDDET